MRYLSIDIEATGLNSDCLLIEFAMVPFCTKEKKIYKEMAFETLVHCPPFEELKPKLDSWVVEHNKELITRANNEGLPLEDFKARLGDKLDSKEYKKFFSKKKITLFGKSLSAIDLPFLTRDLGNDFMSKYFSHKNLDLTCFLFALVDLDFIPKGSDSSSGLMKYLNLSEVDHTALSDATVMANAYLSLLEKFKEK